MRSIPRSNTENRKSAWLEIARGLLEQPTAPIREQLPQEYIRAFARERGLALEEDPSGNLLVKYGGGNPKSKIQNPKFPLVLVAHLDHPGFWVEEVSGGEAELSFKGWVGVPHAKAGTRIRFFETGQAESCGAGELRATGHKAGRLLGATARITEGRAAAGGFAMWDFPGFSLLPSPLEGEGPGVRGEFIVTRCCDDLLGAAAALCALDEIARLKPKGIALWGLFTRAEEIGFLGALEAIRHKTIPKNARVLSLECSKSAGIAPQGEGVVVRVGDRASIFDPVLSEALRQAAGSVSREDPEFKHQRKLMDGGSCEATVFCAHGYRSSGLALPLGNYHNQAFENSEPCIGPETVHAGDFACEVQLLVELARRPELLDERAIRMPDWLKERAAAARNELAPGAPPHSAHRRTWVD